MAIQHCFQGRQLGMELQQLPVWSAGNGLLLTFVIVMQHPNPVRSLMQINFYAFTALCDRPVNGGEGIFNQVRSGRFAAPPVTQAQGGGKFS